MTKNQSIQATPPASRSSDLVTFRHYTKKELREMANKIASDVHNHFGCGRSNERRIYDALRKVQVYTLMLEKTYTLMLEKTKEDTK